MRKDNYSLKARLLAKFEQQLDEVLSRLDEAARLDLDEIEEIALKTRAEIGQELTQARAETETRAPTWGATCPKCQQEMGSKGQKHKIIGTLSGEIEVERPYYDCNRCRKGLFPPG